MKTGICVKPSKSSKSGIRYRRHSFEPHRDVCPWSHVLMLLHSTRMISDTLTKEEPEITRLAAAASLNMCALARDNRPIHVQYTSRLTQRRRHGRQHQQAPAHHKHRPGLQHVYQLKEKQKRIIIGYCLSVFLMAEHHRCAAMILA